MVQEGKWLEKRRDNERGRIGIVHHVGGKGMECVFLAMIPLCGVFSSLSGGNADTCTGDGACVYPVIGLRAWGTPFSSSVWLAVIKSPMRSPP